MNLTRRAFCAFASTAVATAAVGLAGCSSSGPDQGDTALGTVDLVAQPESRDLMGSPDACTARVGLIMGPPSMGLSQFIVAARAGKTFNDFQFELSGVDYVGASAAFNQGSYDMCTLPSNIGPILYNNKGTKERLPGNKRQQPGRALRHHQSIRRWLPWKTCGSHGVAATAKGAARPEYTIEALLGKIWARRVVQP